jgi:O-antigen/teichoic acid export membrane protein
MHHKITQGTLYLTFSSILFIISGYIINITLARQLGPSNYGIYGVIITLLSIINIFQASGFTQTVSKFISENNDMRDQILSTAIRIQFISIILISIILTLFSDLIAVLLNDLSLSPYIRFLAIVIPSYSYYALFLDYQNGLHNFKKQAIMSSIYSVSKVILIIPLSLFYGIYGILIGFAVSPALALTSGIYIPKANGNYAVKKLVMFSIPLMFFIFFSTLLYTVDILLVKSLLRSNIETGYYSAIQNLSKIPIFGLSAFATILFPLISKSLSDNKPNVTKSLINNGLRYILILIVPTVLLISSTSNEIIELIFSNKYLPGSTPLSILIIGTGFLAIFTVLTSILNGASKPHLSMIISLVGIILIFLFGIYLIPIFGLVGAALATTLGSIIVTTISCILIYKNFNTLLSLSSFFKILLSSIAIYLLSFLIKLPIFFLPLKYILLLGIYGILLVLLKEINKLDVSLFNSLIPTKLKGLFKS